MCPGIGTFARVNAKVRAMRSDLLGESTLISLARAPDMDQFMNILSRTLYGPGIENRTEENAFSEMLLQFEIKRFKSIQKQSAPAIRDLIRLLLERYDGEGLKIILRYWHKKIKPAGVYQPALYDFPTREILEADSMETISDLISHTPFQEAVSSAASAYKQENTLFPVEISLDRTLFTRIWHGADGLNRRDCDLLHRLVGTEIDLKNLQWIVRLRRYYKMHRNQIMKVLLPYGHALGEEGIKKILTGENVSKIIQKVSLGIPLDLTREWDTTDPFAALEQFLYQVLLLEARHAFAAFPFSIGSILGYFYLLRIETKNLRILMQSRKYGLTAESAEALLVR